MDEKKLHVLVIEDNEDDYTLLLRALSKESLLIDATRVDTAEALQEALDEKKWDVVISDNNVPDPRINVKYSLELSRNINPNVPFIIVSGTIGEENAVKLMKLGVNDYILKNSLTRLGPALKREVMEADSRLKKQEAEKKLTESEERYRLLAESIKDMFFAMNEELICTFWNKAAEKMTGTTSAKAVGRHIFELLPKAASSALKEKIYASIATMQHGTIEFELTIANVMRYYEVTIYPSREMHSVMVKDITEAKTITRQLKTVNEELETFIYRVSHDIRGPLASMQGLVYLAKNEKFPRLAEDLFGRIGKSADRLEEVIRSLQDIVKIKQDEIELKPASITAIWDEARMPIPDSLCDFKMEAVIPLQDNYMVTDPQLLTMIFQKLIANAIVFRHPLRKPSVLFRFHKKEGEYYQFTITDNGAGIAKDQIDNIFKMFYRGSNQSTGPGLGLYLAASAIHKLGGSIKVTSTLDEGAAFSIRLPFYSKIESPRTLVASRKI